MPLRCPSGTQLIMRKSVIWVICMVLVGLVAWGIAMSRSGYIYSQSKVIEEISRIAEITGARLTEERMVSGSLRARAPGASILDSLSRKLSGRPLMDEVQTLKFEDGPDVVVVQVYHSGGKAGSVEVHSPGAPPGSPPPKAAAAIISGLPTVFPKLDCHLLSP